MKAYLLTIIAIIFLPFGSVSGQNKTKVCNTNHNSPPRGAYHWPPDTAVKVYLVRNMFSPEQRATLLAAMAGWTDGARRMGAGVRFEYAGESAGVVSCQNCLTVTRREIHKYDRKHYAFFNPLKRNEAGLLVAAWIDFDFATKDPQALRGFMVHELGHGLGLWDCTGCQKRKTIMNAFPGINKDNGLTEPSPCDLEVVRLIYWLERTGDQGGK